MQEDLISRQAVLALPRNITRNMRGEVVEETIDVAAIKGLPPAQSEHKMGRWIVWYECPNCGEERSYAFDTCPMCGADMRGEQNG